MHISKVSLINYRNFVNASFSFKSGINTIIGENGSGKTNLFRAMRLMLEDSSYQYAYKLDEGDFNRSIGDWRGHWIIISIEFDDISEDEAIQSLFIHGVGEIDKKDFVKKASYNLYFRPKADVRLKLSELKAGDKAGLQEIIDSITIDDSYETFFAGKSTADFSDPDTYKELVGDFEKVQFEFNIDASKYGIRIPHQLSVAKEISFTFIQALRDVVSDFHGNRTNPLLALLKSKSGDIKASDFDPISQLVKELNEGIESLPDVQTIRDDIRDTIRDAVGETYSPSSLSIKSSLSDEADKLLQSLKLFIGEPDETYEGGIHELSLGGANLIFLTLKLLQYKYNKSKETFANFLIIEEPEAHIHTHIQKTLFDNLNYGDTQIIYSTHSTHISEVSNIGSMNILAKRQNYAEVFQPGAGLNKKSLREVQRYLDAVRSNLLFAKGVILVEGDAEEILIPVMVKKVFGISLDEFGISLINIRSTGFENVAQLFHDDRIQRKCSIVTDLDEAISDTEIEDGDSADVIVYKKSMKKANDLGAARKEKLDELAKKNKWVKPFYAKHTFEIDFVTEGNAYEVKEIVEKVYSLDRTRTKAKEDLDSSEVEVYGQRVLRMANQEGKGWFAIMLGEKVFFRTVIPKYIIKAIIFARSIFNKGLVIDIVQYRIKQHFEEDKTTDITSVEKVLSEYRLGKADLKTVNLKLKDIIPDDQLIDFLKLL
jgi:putative ATP-dependent endonuclease of OLD family